MAKFDLGDGDYTAHGARIAIVASRFNQHVVGPLLEGAHAALAVAEGELDRGLPRVEEAELVRLHAEDREDEVVRDDARMGWNRKTRVV